MPVKTCMKAVSKTLIRSNEIGKSRGDLLLITPYRKISEAIVLVPVPIFSKKKKV